MSPHALRLFNGTNLRFPGVTTYYQLQPEKAPDRDLTTATFDCAGVRIGCLSASEIKRKWFEFGQLILLRIFFWHRNWPQIWHFIFVPFWSPYLKSLILYILCKIYTNEHEHFPHWIECHNICSPDLKSFLKIMTLKFYREKKKKHTHNRN